MARTLHVESTYNCTSCGAPMYHRGDLQPSITYAQCWTCWGQEVIADRDRLRHQLNVAIGIIWVVAIIGAVGWAV